MSSTSEVQSLLARKAKATTELYLDAMKKTVIRGHEVVMVKNQESILDSEVTGIAAKLVITELEGKLIYAYRVTVQVNDQAVELMVCRTRFPQLIQQEGLLLSQFLQRECRPLWDDGRKDRRTWPRIWRALSRLRQLFRWKA